MIGPLLRTIGRRSHGPFSFSGTCWHEKQSVEILTRLDFQLPAARLVVGDEREARQRRSVVGYPQQSGPQMPKRDFTRQHRVYYFQRERRVWTLWCEVWAVLFVRRRIQSTENIPVRWGCDRRLVIASVANQLNEHAVKQTKLVHFT
jgi:hypothetical protein